MADKYPTHDAGPTNWSVSMWDDDDTNSKDEAKPGSHNTFLTVNSGNITLDETTGFLTSLDMTGYGNTFAMGTEILYSVGNTTLDGTITADAGATINNAGDLVVTTGMTFDVDATIQMTATGGSKTITSNGITIGPLTINDMGGSGVFTLADALTCAAFVLTDGSFSTGNFAFTPVSISGTGGELTFGTSTVTASGDITLDNIIATVDAGNITATNLDIGPSGGLTIGGNLTTDANVLVDGGTLALGDNTWIQASGNTINYTSGTITSTGANLHHGTIQNVTSTGTIHCWGVTDGGNNNQYVAHEGGSAGAAVMTSSPALLAA